MFRHAPALGKRKLSQSCGAQNLKDVLLTSSEGACVNSNQNARFAKRFQTFCSTTLPERTGVRRRIQVLDDDDEPDGNKSVVHVAKYLEYSDSAKPETPEERRERNVQHSFTKQERRCITLLSDKPFKSIERSSSGESGSAMRRGLAASTSSVRTRTPPLLRNNVSVDDTGLGDASSSQPTPLDAMRRDKRRWHEQQQQQRRAQLENDAQLVDQGTAATVGQLLTLLLRGSLWLERSPLVVQYWVTQLNANFTLAQCMHQVLMNRAQLTYSVNQNVLFFEQSPLLSVPLELLEQRARLALQALSAAFTVRNATEILENRASAVPREPFFAVRSMSSNGQCLEHHRGFRFNHVLEQMMSVARIALVRDIGCEVLRMGFCVLASNAALENISCALQQAFCHVRHAIKPLEERAIRGATLDTYLNRKELELLFCLQQREQLLLTLIGCVHCGVLHALVQQYLERGERAMRQAQTAPD